MASRLFSVALTGKRIGHTAKTERSNGAWDTISSLSTYPANGLSGDKLIGITADGPKNTHVLYLTADGAIELVKGLMSELMENHAERMATDNEYAEMLKAGLSPLFRK